jgi:hypothetical protein
VVEEELLVGKRSLIRGGVRIYSHHVSEPVEQQRSGATSTQGSIRATGLSPHSPAPSAMSGFGSTAGAGTLAGESTAGTSSDLRSGYAREFERPYGSDSSIDESDPAWEYGYANASDPRYRGKPWDDVENDLRSNYERDYPGSSWDQAKGTMRSGWDKVTGQR